MAQILKVWESESPNFRNTEAWLNALRNSVSSEIDRNAVDSAQSEQQIMNYLYFKYGTRLVVSGKMLDELETCKAPSSETLETFLVNTVVTCDFVMREKQASLVTPQRLYKIVTNNFEQSLSLYLAKRLLKLKDQC